MHVVEQVRTGERRALREPARTRAVHRKDGKHDIQAEIFVQLPGPEQCEVQGGPAHRGAVHAHKPWSWLVVSQH